MEALANIARQNTTAAQSNANVPAHAPSYPAPSNGTAMPGSISIPGMPPPPFGGAPHQPSSQPVNVPALPFSLPPAQPTYPSAPAPLGVMPAGTSSLPNPYVPGYSAPPPLAAVPAAPPAAAPAPAAAAPGMQIDPKMQQQLALITTLMAQGLPGRPDHQDRSAGNGHRSSRSGISASPGWRVSQFRPCFMGWGHDRSGHDSVRSPRQNRGRSRSRSPRGWGSRDSPRGRHNDRGFDYGDHDRAGEYRQRSPAGEHRGQSPSDQEPDPAQKWVDYDPALPNGSIKVYSRTLFVGGVT